MAEAWEEAAVITAEVAVVAAVLEAKALEAVASVVLAAVITADLHGLTTISQDLALLTLDRWSLISTIITTGMSKERVTGRGSTKLQLPTILVILLKWPIQPKRN